MFLYRLEYQTFFIKLLAFDYNTSYRNLKLLYLTNYLSISTDVELLQAGYPGHHQHRQRQVGSF